MLLGVCWVENKREVPECIGSQVNIFPHSNTNGNTSWTFSTESRHKVFYADLSLHKCFVRCDHVSRSLPDIGQLPKTTS